MGWSLARRNQHNPSAVRISVAFWKAAGKSGIFPQMSQWIRGLRLSHVSWRLAYCRPLHRQKLLIADGLEGGGVGGKAGREKIPHLAEKSLLHHHVHTAVDPVTEILPVGEVQADGDGVVPGRLLPGAAVVVGDGLPRLLPDLQGPDDPLLVLQVELFGGGGVDLPQFFQQRGGALGGHPLLQGCSDLPALTALGEVGAPDQGVQPQSGAPHQHGELPPAEDILHAWVGLTDVPGHGPALTGVRHGDHVVGDALRLLRRGGGGADGHAPVDLHGVRRDHLAAESSGDGHAHLGFSAGRGAHDADDFGCHDSSPFFLLR